MQPIKLTSLFCLGALLAAVSARAQMASPPPPPGANPPPTVDSTPMFSFNPLQPTWWQADVSAVYSFRMSTTGISADLGGNIAPHNFLGVEWTYLHPQETDYDPVAGPIHSREDVTTVLLVDRYSIPARRFGWDVPLDFYVGGGAGAGFVREYVTAPRYGIYGYGHDNGVFAADGEAGFRYNLTPNVGVKVGYRYYYLNNVRFFGQKANIDGSALEYGLTFRY